MTERDALPPEDVRVNTRRDGATRAYERTEHGLSLPSLRNANENNRAPTHEEPLLNPGAVTTGNLRRGLIERICTRMRTSLARPMWCGRLASFGPGSAIEPPGWVFGGKGISIATRVWIGRGARLEAFRLESGTVRLSIGEGCKIGPHVHIGAAESVKIGRGVLMASHVYITDHDHDYSDPFDPVTTNSRLLVASVEIGDHVWLGERVCVLKDVCVGERSVIGAGSVVVKDIPPLSIAVGVPARVVRRFDCETKRWIRV